MKLLSWFKSSKKANKAGQRGASLVELATATPLLFVVISGVITSGDLLTQHPWAAQTAYQLVDVLSASSTETGPSLMNARREQLQEERQNRFGRLQLALEQPEFIENSVFNGNSYYGRINGNEVVGVRFRATIRTIWNTSIPTPIRVDVVAPHLARPASVEGLTNFSAPNIPYDCCGVRCGDAGHQCSGGPGTWEPNVCYAGSIMNSCGAGAFGA